MLCICSCWYHLIIKHSSDKPAAAIPGACWATAPCLTSQHNEVLGCVGAHHQPGPRGYNEGAGSPGCAVHPRELAAARQPSGGRLRHRRGPWRWRSVPAHWSATVPCWRSPYLHTSMPYLALHALRVCRSQHYMGATPICVLLVHVAIALQLPLCLQPSERVHRNVSHTLHCAVCQSWAHLPYRISTPVSSE